MEENERTVSITWMIPASIRQRIEEIAKSQDRSASSMVRIILAEWLKDHESANCGQAPVARL